MATKFPRSPSDAIDGLVYFPRMLDKIRINAANELPEGYAEHLGDGFDARCLRFLGVAYDDITARVLAGESDEKILAWCLATGRKPTEEDIEMWSGFMLKRGWRDDATDRVVFRLKEAGMEARSGENLTMFEFIDIDEGRTPYDISQWKSPQTE